MRKLILVLAVVFIAAASVAAYLHWSRVEEAIEQLDTPDDQEMQEDLEKVNALLNESKAEEATVIIRQYEDLITTHTEWGKKWLHSLIIASEQLENLQQLAILYDYFPESFDQREKASVLVARRLMQQKRIEDFDQLRKQWLGKETLDKKWFYLDSDNFVNAGEKKQAIELLGSREFSGKEDSERLIRLAFLMVQENPKKAWKYLSTALKKDPSNPNIHLYRARLLEAAGKQALALSELIAAAQVKPDSIVLRDHVAEFFRRYRRYKQALSVWKELLDKPETDYLWLKTWFWSRAISPISFPWKEKTPPDGALKPLLDYLIALPQGTYWDSDAFQHVSNKNAHLIRRQSTYWLRLIQKLKDGQEQASLKLIESNPFEERSWNPELEETLRRVLTYRLRGTLDISPSSTSREEFEIEEKTDSLSFQFSPQFLIHLRQLAKENRKNPTDFQMPQEIDALLKSEEALTSVFLAFGWIEVGLDLHSLPHVPLNFPSWVSYAVTQALRYNKGALPALEFAMQQSDTPQLSLLIAELLIDQRTPDAAIEKLNTLIPEQTIVGARAAWLKSLLLADKQEFKEARGLVEGHKLLKESVLGKEMLARIALMRGNVQRAEEIYLAIEGESFESKSYLARKAFQQQNWDRARELTEDLLIEYPNNIVLRENLEKIIEKQRISP